jgi:hypothetical protein
MHTPEAHERIIKDRIEAIRIAKKLTKQAVYTAMGISRNSYELKMAGGSLSLREAIRAADLYEMPIEDLLAAA